jgi:hypothetical protein
MNGKKGPRAAYLVSSERRDDADINIKGGGSEANDPSLPSVEAPLKVRSLVKADAVQSFRNLRRTPCVQSRGLLRGKSAVVVIRAGVWLAPDTCFRKTICCKHL